MKIRGLSISVVRLAPEELVFDITGYDVSFANAIRRILLAEVPTMAIEKVELYNNTTVMHDEFLGHRLGLIPIKADAQLFEPILEAEEQETESNSLIFKLNVKNPPTATGNLPVYSRELKWRPIGAQAETFPDGIGPVDGDILIAKLAPSQKIDATLHARKGIGKDHAKYSPVAGCFYRHLTTFELAEHDPLTDEEIHKLRTCFPKGHFKFPSEDASQDDSDSASESDGLQIVNPRLDTTSELTFMSCPSLADKILITTHDNILTFTVESIGTVPADELVLNAIDILRSKCTKFHKIVSKHRRL